MAPPTQRRRANNTTNSSRGTSTPRRRGGRQAHLHFAHPPPENDVAPPVPIDLDPTTRRAGSESLTPPRQASKANKRWAWTFQHMPSQNIEERYYDDITGREVWRCGYCLKQYNTSSGTRSAEEHLASHGLKKGDPRGASVTYSNSTRQQPLSVDFKRQFEIGEEHQFKRRNMGSTDGQSINPDRLELLYTRFVSYSRLFLMLTFCRFISVCSQPLRLVER